MLGPMPIGLREMPMLSGIPFGGPVDVINLTSGFLNLSVYFYSFYENLGLEHWLQMSMGFRNHLHVIYDVEHQSINQHENSGPVKSLK